MPSITPYFDDARDLTYTVAAGQSVSGGQLVEGVGTGSGDRQIQPAGAGSTKVVGVALYDGAAGAKVAVARSQVVPVSTTAVAVDCGAKLAAAASGAVAAVTVATADPRTIVGQALEGRGATAGTIRALIY